MAIFIPAPNSVRRLVYDTPPGSDGPTESRETVAQKGLVPCTNCGSYLLQAPTIRAVLIPLKSDGDVAVRPPRPRRIMSYNPPGRLFLHPASRALTALLPVSERR